jgi:hypothetical protein
MGHPLHLLPQARSKAWAIRPIEVLKVRHVHASHPFAHYAKGWGTRFIATAGEVKSLGHPPEFRPSEDGGQCENITSDSTPA